MNSQGQIVAEYKGELVGCTSSLSGDLMSGMSLIPGQITARGHFPHDQKGKTLYGAECLLDMI